MKILFFAYREWALNIYKELSNKTDNEIIYCNNKKLATIEFINSVKPDLILFYGWSWMIDKNIIDNFFCVCLHPSPLPKYRGGSPIQNQIMNGEKKSAVTLFRMNDKMDEGDIISQSYFSLDGYLDDILQKIEQHGILLTLKLLKDFENNTLNLTAQDSNKSTIFKRRKPSQSEIHIDDFESNDAEHFYNLVRGLQDPYPNAYIKCKNGSKLYLLKVAYEQSV